MSFNSSTMSYHINLYAACRQFNIKSDPTVRITLSGPSRYTHLRLVNEQAQEIKNLANKVGIHLEKGGFMVYSAIFRPNQVQELDDTCEATAEEKKVFWQIFETAAADIAEQMGWSVSPEDVEKIVLEKTVDSTFILTKQACVLSIELSESAANRLGMDQDNRFHEFYKSSSDDVMKIIHPGEDPQTLLELVCNEQ